MEGGAWSGGVVRLGMAPADVDAGAGFAKTRPQENPRVHFCTRTRGFREPAGVTTYTIKMHKSINLNSQIAHFYK